VALEYGYTQPEVHEGTELEIIAGRHPVVETTVGTEPFVPNDTRMDCEHNQLLIITGPNMAGKSTYLRQVALIVLLAQIGCFVPAQRASIGLCDRIFTRVGAMDDLATGQSTFMVEMTETALILNNATERSLIVLDEIGRGTSTFDGLSIAWAVSEHLVNQVGAKTLFATHYHHLNELAEILPRVRNYRVTVKEEAEDIVFLRRIVPGGTDRSYGIQVARLAGLPTGVIDRAKEVLAQLETEDLGAKAAPSQAAAARISPPIQLQLFEAAQHPIARSLRALNTDELTPLEALVKLKELREEAERG
jgi:DNA mismatch repair protein MutS